MMPLQDLMKNDAIEEAPQTHTKQDGGERDANRSRASHLPRLLGAMLATFPAVASSNAFRSLH